MKADNLKFFTAIALLFFAGNLFSQGKEMYMMKDGAVVFKSDSDFIFK